MLFIGDIHANSKIVDRVIDGIRDYVDLHSKEKNIIFLGDFVYHFSYDRKALLKVFGLFVELYKQGKNVYVLAGNHDWISNQFVFSEGEMMVNALSGDDASGGSIEFITKPMQKNIEGQDILFFPYFGAEKVTLEKKEGQFETLIDSSSFQERRSGYANNSIFSLIEKWKSKPERSEKLMIIHHWYINNTAFPGQFARFSFNSPALSDELLHDDDLLLVSGHLHKPFIHKNYLCCGSIRSTSPLEQDQCKYFFSYDVSSHTYVASSININPYITIDRNGKQIGPDLIDDRIDTIISEAEGCFEDSHRHGSVMSKKPIHKDCQISIITQEQQHRSLDSLVEDELLESFKAVAVKKRKIAIQELVQDLHDASLELDVSIADRKTLLQRFIKARFGEREDEYLKALKVLEIL